MDDLISRQAAIALAYFHGKTATWDNPIPDGVDAVDVADLEKLPAVQIEPKQGEWIMHIDDLFPCESTQECSVCHAEQLINGNDDNFCPNCGAIMVGGENNG